MPLQNRVSPWGDLNAISSKGTLMGNRGILHDKERKIVRAWANKNWITCLLDFNGVDRRPLFQEGRYSELFFLDEATAYAAGHRPCAECQRERYKSFKETWAKTHGNGRSVSDITAKEIDHTLHNERALPGGLKRKFAASLASLPEGTIFEIDNAAYLFYSKRFFLWSYDEYTPAQFEPSDVQVNVLTPKSIVQLFEAGFTPRVHRSAEV